MPSQSTCHPERGQWWRHRETGACVWVGAVETGPRFVLVRYSLPGTFWGAASEDDFVKEYAFHA